MNTSAAYQQVADYLNHLERFGIKPGLERIRALMERFDNPHLKYPVILVGGTNGKGSTVEFIACILRCADYKVGVYTSPHIYRYSERIRVMNRESAAERGQLFPGEIPDDDLLRLLNTVRPVAEDIERATNLSVATVFEILTAMAFIHFAEQNVDIAIVEVGLGGRWDATNITEPIVSVITNVDLDHTERLGDTVEKIAREKVEIARTGRVLVTAETKPEVLRVLEEMCEQHGVLLKHSDEILLQHGIGQFQQPNAQLAVAAVNALRNEGHHATTFDHSESPHQLPSTIPGRFEIMANRPYIVLDGANNPAGIKKLMTGIHAYFQRNTPGPIVVLGISADKAVEEMVSLIAPLARTVIATQAQNPRAAPAERIAAEARNHCNDVRVVVPVMDAIRTALEIAEPHFLVVITGSFFVLGEVDREELAARDLSSQASRPR